MSGLNSEDSVGNIDADEIIVFENSQFYFCKHEHDVGDDLVDEKPVEAVFPEDLRFTNLCDPLSDDMPNLKASELQKATVKSEKYRVVMTNAGAVIVIDDDPFSNSSDDKHEDSEVGNTLSDDDSSKLNFKGFLDIDSSDHSLQGFCGILKIFGDNSQQRERSAQVMNLLLQHRRFSTRFSKRGPAAVPACRPSFREQTAGPVQGMIAESVSPKKRGRPPGLTQRATDKSISRKRPGPKPGSKMTRAMSKKISGENRQNVSENYQVVTRKKPGPKPGFKRQKKVENQTHTGEMPQVLLASYSKKPGPKPGFKRQKKKQDIGKTTDLPQKQFQQDNKHLLPKKRRGRPPRSSLKNLFPGLRDPQPEKEKKITIDQLPKRRRGRPTGYSPKLKKIVLKQPILSKESDGRQEQGFKEVSAALSFSSTGAPMEPLAMQPPVSSLNLLDSDEVHKSNLVHDPVTSDTVQSVMSTDAAKCTDLPQYLQHYSSKVSESFSLPSTESPVDDLTTKPSVSIQNYPGSKEVLNQVT